MLIYGHRGASAVEPENTLRAFSAALNAGAQGLEFDVQATADRVPVILHDRDLARTTDAAGPIDRHTRAQLARIDAGKGERVPTLDEALALVGDAAHLDIEVKQGGIEAEVLETLARHPRARWSVSSFDWTCLARFRARSTEADLWLLAVQVSDALFAMATELGASAVSLHHAALTAETASRLRDAALGIVIWTVNDVEEARRCRDLGAMGLCTDDPARIIAALSASAG